jgi:hypothetical protein
MPGFRPQGNREISWARNAEAFLGLDDEMGFLPSVVKPIQTEVVGLTALPRKRVRNFNVFIVTAMFK